MSKIAFHGDFFDFMGCLCRKAWTTQEGKPLRHVWEFEKMKAGTVCGSRHNIYRNKRNAGAESSAEME